MSIRTRKEMKNPSNIIKLYKYNQKTIIFNLQYNKSVENSDHVFICAWTVYRVGLAKSPSTVKRKNSAFEIIHSAQKPERQNTPPQCNPRRTLVTGLSILTPITMIINNLTISLNN